MAQVGITFDQCNVTSANDAHFHWTFLNHTNGVTKGCAVTATTTTITIAKGYFIICGRMVQITGAETLTPTLPSTSGSTYALLVYEIDLTKTNTVGDFQQGYFKILTSSSTYPTPTQEDLDDDGTLYQLPFARFILKSSGITQFVSSIVSINFTDLYSELTRQRNEYVAILDDYLEQFAEAGFLKTSTYQSEHTKESVTLPVNGWTQYATTSDPNATLYKQKIYCSSVKLSTSDACEIRMTPCLTTRTKAGKRAMDRALSYILPNPTINYDSDNASYYIEVEAFAAPTVVLRFYITGGDGTD